MISALGYIVLIIGLFGGTILCASYSSIAFSDPGIVYDMTDEEEQINTEVAAADGDQDVPYSGGQRITPQIYRATPRVVQTVDCGHCKIKRPITSTQ